MEPIVFTIPPQPGYTSAGLPILVQNISETEAFKATGSCLTETDLYNVPKKQNLYHYIYSPRLFKHQDIFLYTYFFLLDSFRCQVYRLRTV